VTRLKTNTPLTVETERLIEPGGPILSDRTGSLPERLTNSRRNPMGRRVREVCVRIETGKVLRIVTNDLDATAEQIADLYKRRWAIELFFRWVKQTLKIKHFLGHSENAVRIQIAVALTAYLLLRLAQATHDLACSPLLFARLAQANIMHRKTLAQLLAPDPIQPTSPDPRQGALQGT
jgi:IS4 transposase